MYNVEYEKITQGLNSREKDLLVKALDNPVKSIPSVITHLTELGLIEVYQPGSYTTTNLGYDVASYLQNQFSLIEDEESYDEAKERWRITFDIVIPKKYGSFMAVEQFRDHVFVSEALESRAVSVAHSMMRNRYQTASRIRVISRETFQLPSDIDQPVEFMSSESSD